MRYSEKNKLLTVVTLLISLQFSYAQQKLNSDSLSAKLLRAINTYRIENKIDELDTNYILKNASVLQAEFMAKNEENTEEHGSRKIKTTHKRVELFGGSRNAEEVTGSFSTKNGAVTLSEDEIVKLIMSKWTAAKKVKIVILDGNFSFCGVGLKTDSRDKKIYVSAVFAGFNIYNLGAKKGEELEVEFTEKNKKLKRGEPSDCKACDKFKDDIGLHNALQVRDNKVFLVYDDLKNFKRLIKDKKDGLIIDVVQKAQYANPSYNIYDNNLISKGILLKKNKTKSIYKSNLAQPEKKGKKVKKLEVELGEIPKEIKGDYELNLLVLKNGKYCKTITRSYIEEGKQNSYTPVEMLWIPDSNAYFNPPFNPTEESLSIEIVIPFEKNKSEYKHEDIQLFLDTLNVPDFIVNRMNIFAYASIEGDSIQNAKLQQKRAESIVKAMESKQKNSIKANIYLSDSWKLFCDKIKNTEYAYLAEMPKSEAIKEINKGTLSEQLENYLAPTRFAKITMDVSYDFENGKEEKFVIDQFNKAVKDSSFEKMYKIQYYIAKGVRDKKFNDSIFLKMQIPYEPFYAEVLMNNEVFKYKINKKVVTEDNLINLDKLRALDKCSYYIEYNQLFSFVKQGELTNQKSIDEIQKKIDNLYKSVIPKSIMDGLNLEYQFKIIDFVDTSDVAQPSVQKAIDKIKTFYKFEDATWQNALKIAYVFVNFREYKQALDLLKRFAGDDKVDEQLLFTYLSLGSQFPTEQKSKLYAKALKKASELNKKRYCELFGAPYLSFQLQDIPQIKKDYIASGCN